MTLLLPLLLAGLKALVLMAAAAALAQTLRGRPARQRALVWAAALTGSLLLPILAPLVPVWFVPVPVDFSPSAPPPPAAPGLPLTAGIEVAGQTLAHPHGAATVTGATGAPLPAWPLLIIAAWAVGATVLAGREGARLCRMASAVGRSRPVTEATWLNLLDRARERVGCRRAVRLVVSPEVDVPATLGLLRPVVVLPPHADSWLHGRRQAVLLHELVHIRRLDWPIRVMARLARSVHWFNPLAWWAVQRLDLEQELACDEEVVALGTRPSDYACHLLSIARTAVRRPSPALSSLEMARRSHLEQRIMTLLDNTTHRRVTLAVLAPAVVILALVPALAAVHPGDAPARPASPELRQAMAEMRATEARLQPHLDEIEAIEQDMQPRLEAIESIEMEIDHEKLEAIELQMQPYLERIETIEIDMAPFHEQMEALETQLEQLEIHVEDGTLAEVQHQIQEQIEAHLGQIESVHIDMEGFHRQIEAVLDEMEPLHEQLATLHSIIEPHHEGLQRLHQVLEPFHTKMATLHRVMEPLHEEMELLGDRLHVAVRADIETVLREHLGPVTSPAAPIGEAADRIAEDADLRVHDDVVEVSATPREVRTILTDLLTEHRLGSEQGFEAAISAAADALCPLELAIE